MSTVKKNKASKELQSGEMRSSKASLLEVMCITQRTRLLFKIIQGGRAPLQPAKPFKQ